jgi:hypothetical protein
MRNVLRGSRVVRPSLTVQKLASRLHPGPRRCGDRVEMQWRRGGRSELSCEKVASDHQDDRPCHQRKRMRCPRRQEAAPGELVRVRDACHTHKTAWDRLSFRAPQAAVRSLGPVFGNDP